MQKFTRLALVISIAAALGSANAIYASAPVYDADSAQQSDDGTVADQGQDVPPPAPDQPDQPMVGEQGPPSDTAPGPDQSDQPADNADQGTFLPAQQVAPQATKHPAQAKPVQSAELQDAPPPPPYAAGNLTIEQRLRRLEIQVNSAQSGDSAQRIESLQDQVQTLRGQVEQLAHQLEQVQAQQKSMYNDLDRRVSQTPATPKTPAIDVNSAVPGYKRKMTPAKTPSATAAPAAATSVTSIATVTSKPTDNQPNVAEEQQIYQTAYDQIKSKKYTDAIATLQNMLKKYPSGQFASNAHYWLGELYGIVGKSDEALTEFTTVVKSYPDSPRISDAQLKVGLIYATQSKWVDAKSAFKKVINHYPGTASSRLASEQLKQLKEAGH